MTTFAAPFEADAGAERVIGRIRLPAPPADYARRMPMVKAATELVDVGPDAYGRAARLTPAAAVAWQAMREAAARDGARLLLLSAFRSVERQAELLQAKLRAGVALEEALRVLAYPGHSEHHTGRAVDLGSPHGGDLAETFEDTPEFAWLVRHAARFGFSLSYPRGHDSGVGYEPWHWLMREPADEPKACRGG